jgi:hypothetical protein
MTKLYSILVGDKCQETKWSRKEELRGYFYIICTVSENSTDIMKSEQIWEGNTVNHIDMCGKRMSTIRKIKYRSSEVAWGGTVRRPLLMEWNEQRNLRSWGQRSKGFKLHRSLF